MKKNIQTSDSGQLATDKSGGQMNHIPQNHNESPSGDYHPALDTGNNLKQSELTLGGYLRDERQKKNISLKAVSHSTKINATMLDYLEADDLSHLPNKAYVVGYVKSYCKFLQLDLKYCLELADRTLSPHHSGLKKEKEVVLPERNQHPKKKAWSLILLSFTILLVLGGAIFYALRNQSVTQSDQSPPVETKIEPEVLTEKTPLFREATPQEEQEFDQLQKIEFEEQKAVSDKQLNTKALIPKTISLASENIKEALNQDSIEEKAEITPVIAKDNKEKTEAEKSNERNFHPIPTPLFTLNSQAQKDEIEEYFPTRFQNAMIAGKENIFINAVDGDTWLTYKSDEHPTKKFILKKGQNLLVRGDDVRIFLGNVRVTKIFYNGKMLNITSSSGVKSLVFPISNAKDLKLPLFVYKKDGSVITSEEFIKNN